MKTNVLVLTAGLMSITGCHSVLHSDLTVQPRKQFVLGGNQPGAFTVQARNKGEVSVMITERRANGQTTPLGIFSPGDRQTIRLATGSAVLITNTATQPARLDLSVTGDKGNLTMQERIPGNP